MAQTLVVGSCKPNQPSYATIQAAVDAAGATPGATVLVCPGTYAEQVSIATPLTLKGLSLTPQTQPTHRATGRRAERRTNSAGGMGPARRLDHRN